MRLARAMGRKMTATATLLLGSVAAVGAPAQDEQVTYNSHAARIINDNCVVCHREGGIGPMQLETYEQVRPWAPLIQLRVANREMPPYAYDHGVGIQDLLGDWRLAQEEIDTIVAWVDQGAPQGDPDIVPPAAQLPDADAWNFVDRLGEPDLVIRSEPIDVPVDGNDLWSSHYVYSGLTEDRCIKAVQVKPRLDAKAVVHHANTYFERPNEEGEFERTAALTEYAMGKWGELMPEGVCRLLPADARIAWEIHMFPGGLGVMAPRSVIKDNVVELGLWLHDEGYLAEQNPYEQDLAQYRMRDGYLNGELVIPPHGYAMTQGFHSFDHPVRIDSFQPHGHLRMNAASLEVFYPSTGTTEQISQISNWSATWHHSHIYHPDAAPLLPVGAVLVIKQWYDNTARNPNNPDPDQWVFDGGRTGDEMSHAWIAVTHLDDEGYEKLLAGRGQKAPQAPASP